MHNTALRLPRPALVLLVLAALLFAGTGLARADYEQATAVARAAIAPAIESGSAAAATVAIINNGTIVYSEQFGTIELDGAAVDGQTQFNIGSVSKVFTAVALLKLVDLGKLALDDQVTTLLPGLQMEDSRDEEITVRMLVDHTAALPGSNFHGFISSRRETAYPDETIAYLNGSTLKSDPGGISVYSNDGFTLAEKLIAEVSDEGSYGAFLQARIFTPCGMSDTSCYFRDGNANYARFETATRSMPREFVNAMGAGGIASTADDLCRFGHQLFQGGLLSEASLTELKNAQYGPDTALGELPRMNSGLGWDSVAVPQFAARGVQVLAKNGGTLSFHSELFVAPAQDVAVAISYCGDPAESVLTTATDVMQAVMEELGVLSAPDAAADEATEAAIPAGTDSTFEGIYANAGSVIKAEFDMTANTVKFSLSDGDEYRTAETAPYMSDGLFHGADMNFRFVTYKGNDYILQVVDEGLTTHMVFAERIAAVSGGLTSSDFDDTWWRSDDAGPKDFAGGEVFTFKPVKDMLGNRMAGYIQVVQDGSATPYALADAATARMALKYGRDISDLRIADGVLEYGNFTYSPLGTPAALAPAGTVTTDARGGNEWRRATGTGVLSCTLPENGAILTFEADGEGLYDSRWTTDTEISLAVATGQYVCFIGDPGVEFAYEFPKTQAAMAAINTALLLD